MEKPTKRPREAEEHLDAKRRRYEEVFDDGHPPIEIPRVRVPKRRRDMMSGGQKSENTLTAGYTEEEVRKFQEEFEEAINLRKKGEHN